MCLLTSLSAEQATPERLLKLNRGYWGIANGIHYVRDMVAVGEAGCRVRSNALPCVMAALANLAVSILRLLKVRNIRRTMKQLLFADGASGVTTLLLA